VTAELVATETGERLWSGSFRHGVEEWRMAQEKVARAVTEKLQERLGGPVAGTTMFRQRTQNPEAYNLYLKGVFQANQRTEASLRRSLTLHQGALVLDPAYPPALAGLAETYLLLGIYNYWQPLLAYPKAKEAAVRAVQLDETLATGHNALACANAVFDRDRTRAELSFRRAMDLNPNHVLSHQWFAVMCLSPAGRHDEALDHLRMAQGLDPLSLSVPASLGLVLYLSGRLDEALEQCRATVEMDENFWLPNLFLGWALHQKGEATAAAEAFESAIVLSQGDPSAQAALAYLHAREDAPAESQGWVDRLLALAKSRYVPAAEIALVYGALGDLDQARDWTRKAIDEHSFRLVYSAVDPRFEPLRRDPGCAALLG
jgi:tetratricopeptide (TPR) repeat protein